MLALKFGRISAFPLIFDLYRLHWRLAPLLDTVSAIVLVAIIALVVAALKLKDKQKKIAVIALYVVMTLYVGGKYYQSIFHEKRLDKASPAIDVDRAELMLRMGSALESIKASTKSMPGSGAVIGNQKQTDVYVDAEKVLRNAAKLEPDSESAWGKLAVVEHIHGTSYTSTLEHLSKINSAGTGAGATPGNAPQANGSKIEHAATVDQPATSEEHAAVSIAGALKAGQPTGLQLSNALKAIFTGPLPADQAAETKKILLSKFPTGWYQDRVLKLFYERTKNKAELSQLEDKTSSANFSLFIRLLLLAAFVFLSLLIGVIVIFVQLLFVARNSTDKDQSDLVKAPVYTSPATIYGVFIAWITTQSMIGALAQSAMQSISPVLKMSGGMEPNSNKPVLIALTVATLYLVSNGPGTLYAYLLAMRPAGVRFFEGFRLRTRIGKRGPIGLVLYGLMTWFAAVPLVLIATIIGVKLGSQGSSNPIIALVMEAARSGNWVSTILFYLTLGVLAPMCEETLFRGFLYSNLRRSMGVFPAMIISAGLFAAFHLDLGAFLPLFTLGSLFALVFEKTKSIVPSMVAHGLWNSGTFSLLIVLFS